MSYVTPDVIVQTMTIVGDAKNRQWLFNPVADEPLELATDTSKAELPGHAIPVEVDASKTRLLPAAC
jgi:hypothetical protein